MADSYLKVKDNGANGLALFREESDVSVNEISDGIEKAIPTENASGTNSGVTCEVLDSGYLKVYGESTAVRMFLYLNGQNSFAVNSTPFSATFPAGTYAIDLDVTSASTPNVIFYYTYSTFASGKTAVKTANPTAKITFTEPVMFGFRFLSDTNFGTTENPTLIKISVKEATANDKVARGKIEELANQIDNDDVTITTYISESNSNHGDMKPDQMLIALKRNAFAVGVKNNDPANTNGNGKAYRATRSAYYWLQYYPDVLFATNCNFSGGESTEAVDASHYALRYYGVDYAALNPPRQRPFFAIDTINQDFAYYPVDTVLSDIPQNYSFAFACGDLLVKNGVVQDFEDTENQKNPRLAFGWDDTYIYIFFCEGRNNINAGYTLSELATVMHNYGIANAVNMDGGGSTCICANLPNTTKINEYKDPIQIRPTTLNMHYKYIGTQGGLSDRAKTSIVNYCAKVYKAIPPDLLRLLGEIGNGTVAYQYNSESAVYRLTLTQNA